MSYMEENLEVAGRVIGMMGSRDTKKQVMFVVIGFNHKQTDCVNNSPEFDI